MVAMGEKEGERVKGREEEGRRGAREKVLDSVLKSHGSRGGQSLGPVLCPKAAPAREASSQARL